MLAGCWLNACEFSDATLHSLSKQTQRALCFLCARYFALSTSDVRRQKRSMCVHSHKLSELFLYTNFCTLYFTLRTTWCVVPSSWAKKAPKVGAKSAAFSRTKLVSAASNAFSLLLLIGARQSRHKIRSTVGTHTHTQTNEKHACRRFPSAQAESSSSGGLVLDRS